MGRRPAYRRSTKMVFQHLARFHHMTVFTNLSYGLKIRKLPAKEIKGPGGGCPGGRPLRWPWEAVSEATQRWPAAKRVALARTLILEPNVVLFDEPLGSPDLKLRREMHIEIKNIQRRLGTRFVYLTRDQQEALNMCDQIAIYKRG